MAQRPKLGLAPGSGSARGWAHVGILRTLTDHGIVPDVVAGCSMGAMVSSDRIEPTRGILRRASGFHGRFRNVRIQHAGTTFAA